jgi:hypothetical protein
MQAEGTPVICSSIKSIYMSAQDTHEGAPSEELQKVEVLKNGPLVVHGDLSVIKPDGTTEIRKRSAAFCRCGASTTKPYCDGAHRKIGFEG